MSRNLGYTKKFIILKKDFSNMNLQNPKGHGKIEIKGIRGNISISLEKAEEETYYNVLLIDKNKLYNLGKIYTEVRGKGREELAFNIQDLESSGFQINRLNGILICRDDNILLGGYMDKEDGSIERYIKNIARPIQEEIVEDEIIQENIVEEELIQQDIVEEEVIEEEVIEEEIIEQEITHAEPVKEEQVETIEEQPMLLEEELVEEQLIEKEPMVEEFIQEEIIPLDDNPIMEETILPKEDDFYPVFEPIAQLSQEPEPIAQLETVKLELNNLIIEEDLPKFEESNEAVVDMKLTQKSKLISIYLIS